MAVTVLPTTFLERLDHVRRLERHLLEVAERLSTERPGKVADTVDAVRALATKHLDVIDEHRRRLGVEIGAPEPERDRPAPSPEASELEEIAITIARLVTAYGGLYAAARLLFEGAVADDLAYEHGVGWREAAAGIADLLVTDVHAELVAEGVTCRCQCPACGMGICLCTRNSIETMRELIGRPPPEPGDGVDLRIDPRSGSEMARLGLAKGDRILRVDGEPVRTNPDLQAALKKHPIGEPVPLEVERSGTIEKVSAARATGPP